MPITDFMKHDERGFSISEAVPLDEYHERFPLPLKISEVSWLDSAGNPHVINAKSLLVQVLPDRSGLICLESPGSKNGRYVGQSGAVILNEDGSIRYRLAVPLALINSSQDLSNSVAHFLWIERSDKINQCRLIGSVPGAGDFIFELDYASGQFLTAHEMRL